MKEILHDRKKLILIISLSVLLIAFLIFLYFFNTSIEKPSLVNTNGRTFEKAEVVEIVKDNIQENGARIGNQEVKLKMLTGELAGQIVDATSSDGNLFGATCTVGMKVVTITSISGDVTVTSVYSQDRTEVIYVFIGIFILLICLIGGKNGAKSSLGLIFTMVCIIFLFLPMIYIGFSPFFASVITVIITTFVSVLLIGGFSKKSFIAICATVFGVIVSGLFAAIFGFFAGLDGYNVSDIESLLFVAQSTEIDVGGLLFAGILISALGAVMDVAVSIASAENELHIQKPSMTQKELFVSGINIGKDMMGTMTNTLILAFTGGSLSVLVLDYAYDLPFLQIINSNSIGLEIMQGLSGTVGIVLTVPVTALLASFVLTRKKSKANNLNEEAEALNESENIEEAQGFEEKEEIGTIN